MIINPGILIFEKKWLCMVPRIATYTEYDIEHHGVAVETNDIGKAVEDESFTPTRVMLTIEEMVVIKNKGLSIKVIDYSDIVKIYDVIEEHIIACNAYFNRTINGPKYPQKDLDDLDRLAGDIYVHNKGSILERDLAKYKNARGFFSDNAFTSRYENNEIKDKIALLGISNTAKEREPLVREAVFKPSDVAIISGPKTNLTNRYSLDDLLNE